ncbi:hypothetical protein [Nocardia pseudovaccinii]|uniref:hypothetical protein n=1 Tax=Nocardia pseudovaccinii TaxID=189540 RepID=UPI0007A3A213
MTVHEAPLDHIVQCQLAHGIRFACDAPQGNRLAAQRAGPARFGQHGVDGYTDATPPTESAGMLDTGDLGYLDVAGQLFVAGRDDAMLRDVTFLDVLPRIATGKILERMLIQPV